MELILLEKVTNLGDLGDIVKVKSGYGRNYLLPQGKALTATESNRKVFEERKAELVKKANDSLNAAKLRAGKLAGAVVRVKALAAEEGKLYGPVGPNEIARAAEEQGLDLRKSEIDMPDGVIRLIGTYNVIARMHSEVEVGITVVVEEEKA
ncbi:MAG: 50S ribosomal protein L9 [Nevskia sp.]|nr:50S ribosomal protein L9 [Nevskia sp.]